MITSPAPAGSVLADPAELGLKRDRVLALLETHQAAALALTGSASLAWLLDGARTDVAAGGPAVAAAVVHRDGVALGVLTNERDRLLAEEIPANAREALDLQVVPIPWHGSLDPARWWAGPAPLPEARVAADLRDARASLLPAELTRYRVLCAQVAETVTQALQQVTPATIERALAADLAGRVVALGADPLVVLVSGHGRRQHRHPVPTDAPLGDRAMAVVCARRHGMIANLTRWVGPVPPGAAHAEQALAQVEADALDALVPGTPWSRVLEEVSAAYPRHGFDAQEWTRHHQGGPTGYLGRDPRLVPGVGGQVRAGQVVTLNPTVTGHKLEDTVLVTGDGAVQVLTVDGRWPTTTVRGRARPLPLPWPT